MHRYAVAVSCLGFSLEKVGISDFVRLLGLPPAAHYRHTPTELLYQAENFTLRIGNSRVELFSDRVALGGLLDATQKVVSALAASVRSVLLSQTVLVEGGAAQDKVKTLLKTPLFLPVEPRNYTIGYNAETDATVVTVQATTVSDGVQVELVVEAKDADAAKKVFGDVVAALQKEGLWSS